MDVEAACSGSLLKHFRLKAARFIPGRLPAQGRIECENQTTVRARICCGVVNRGLALYNGMVIAPAIDGRLFALDAETGAIKWVATYPRLDRVNGAPHDRDLNPAVIHDGLVIVAPDDAAAVSAHLRANRETQIRLTLKRGAGVIRFWTCDLTAEYVHLNADYTT